MKNQKKNNQYKDTFSLALGEVIVSFIVVLVYLLLGRYNFTILTGVICGSLVTVLNFFILSVQVNKALNEYITLRGDREMTDEEATAFSTSHARSVQNAVTKSYVFRTGLMIGSLVLAFITGWFDPIATLIPLLCYKPLIYAIEFLNKKRGE